MADMPSGEYYSRPARNGRWGRHPDFAPRNGGGSGSEGGSANGWGSSGAREGRTNSNSGSQAEGPGQRDEDDAERLGGRDPDDDGEEDEVDFYSILNVQHDVCTPTLLFPHSFFPTLFLLLRSSIH